MNWLTRRGGREQSGVSRLGAMSDGQPTAMHRTARDPTPVAQ